MTEKEKRDLGMIYNPNYDPEVQKEMLKCKDICFAFNQLPPSETEQRSALLRKLLGRSGKNCTILSPFWCDYGSQIEVGDNFFANHNLVVLDGAKVRFGDNVFIAPDCGFYTAGHPVKVAERNEGLEYARPITVGNNVVIGAGSVVTRDIPDNVIAFGNPCRVHRSLTPEELAAVMPNPEA